MSGRGEGRRSPAQEIHSLLRNDGLQSGVVIGATLGNYRITARLGEGGMGVVYVAEHALIGRKAAVKVLLPEYSHNQEIVSRFFNEARSTALIKHPGLVDIFDFGYDAQGSAYIVMEYLEGESLASYLRRVGPAGVAAVCGVGRQMAAAVGAAHERGIVHRDLKPDNVFCVPDRESPAGVRVKILDFGIAKLITEGGMGASLKTRTGAVMGTPVYMSPEQCRGAGQVDARSDIYSLGCILYEMICGRPPFVREGVGEIIAAQIFEQPLAPHVLEASVPPALERVILRALAKAPGERQQTMEQLKAELDLITSGRFTTGPTIAPAARPTKAKRSPLSSVFLPLVGALLVLGGLGAFGVWKLGLARRGVAELSADAVPAGPASAPAPGSGPASVPAVAPGPAPAAEVTLHVASTPAGAEVYRAADGVLFGKTPLVRKMPRTEGAAVFLVKLGGYRDERVVLPADRDGAANVSLVKLPRLVRPAPPKQPAKTVEAPTGPKPRKPVRDGVVDPFAQ
jgi:serine/threonine-protein kinase